MPHKLFKYIPQPNGLYFLIELFWLRINQFEFLKSVQKIRTFLCLEETKKEMWQIRWHHKDTRKKGLFFGSYLKTKRSINMKFGYILEKRMLNPSTMLEKNVPYHSFRATFA